MMDRYQGGVVYVIDVGQSVNTTHCRWNELLRRDIHNILEFYNKNGVIRDLEEVKSRLYAFVMTEIVSKDEHGEKDRDNDETPTPPHDVVGKEFDHYLLSKLQ